MTPEQAKLLKQLPAVGTLLEREDVQAWIEETSRTAVTASLREAVAQVRRKVLANGKEAPADSEAVLKTAEALLQKRQQPSLRRVINATGIVLHTGLGRAPLCASAVAAISEAAGGYCNVEYEIDTGKRGKRQRHVTSLICDLTGAEAATVVNNNAAATLMVLKAIAADREVVVSRGQLVEIGGSFRLPDIMAASGAHLREVGTTNRTRIADYANAINEQTGGLMRVHTSNYRIVGFTEEVGIGPLAELAHRHGLVAVDDLGSGALFDLSRMGLPDEPHVRGSIEAGADLVCFSGDKLLGGPQCGIICGRQDLIQAIEKDPLMRTYRTGKLTLLALEATLRHYEDPEQAVRHLPTLARLTAQADELAPRAEALCERLLGALPDENFLVCSDVSYAGGGSLPGDALETVIVQWRPITISAAEAANRLRLQTPTIVARVHDQAVLFDLRTLDDQEFNSVVKACVSAASS